MSRMTDNFRDDIQKSPDELEREIDDTRARIEYTLDLLERKLSPSDMIEEAMRIARRNGGAFASNLATEIRNKPFPTLLAGLGLVWLMSSSGQPSYRGDGMGSGAGDLARDARERAHELGARAREGAHDIGARAHEMGERVQEMGRRAGGAASEAGHGIQDAAHQVSDAARRGARRAADEYQHLLREQPLLLGILGLGIGAALGSVLPRTDIEDEVMGEYSDQMKRKAEEEGRRASGQVRDSAERVAGAAHEQLAREKQAHTKPRDGGTTH
jgi:ElaB/YqjD/DUF883 family membrane-anchored ribosome-binding protein